MFAVDRLLVLKMYFKTKLYLDMHSECALRIYVQKRYLFQDIFGNEIVKCIL